jgi:hypothetical protein
MHHNQQERQGCRNGMDNGKDRIEVSSHSVETGKTNQYQAHPCQETRKVAKVMITTAIRFGTGAGWFKVVASIAAPTLSRRNQYPQHRFSLLDPSDRMEASMHRRRNHNHSTTPDMSLYNLLLVTTQVTSEWT